MRKIKLFLGALICSISPLLSFVVVTFFKVRHVLIPFIAACFSVIFVPFEDGLRYKVLYETISDIGYSPLWDLIMIVCKKVNISFNMFKFLIVFIQYYWIIRIFEIIFNDKKKYYYALFLLIISFRFFSMIYGLRFNFAISLFFCGIFLSSNKLSKLLIVISSVLVHFSLIPIIVIYYASLLKRNFYIAIALFILFLCAFYGALILDSTLFLSFIQYLESYGANNLNTYFLGFWSGEFMESMSFKGKILHYSKGFQFFPFLLVSLKSVIFPKNSLDRFTLYLLIFCLSLFTLQTIYLRFSLILFYVLVFRILNDGLKINLVKYYSLCLVSLYVFALYFYDSIIHTSLDFTRLIFNF